MQLASRRPSLIRHIYVHGTWGTAFIFRIATEGSSLTPSGQHQAAIVVARTARVLDRPLILLHIARIGCRSGDELEGPQISNSVPRACSSSITEAQHPGYLHVSLVDLN